MTPGRRTLFLHVGLPRCASSALQDWAGTNRALLARQAVTWPETEPSGYEAARHQGLFRALRGGPQAESEAARFVALLDQAPGDLLMSDEGLSRQFDDFAPERLAWFREVTQDWNVRLILMTRDLGDWKMSMWKHAIVSPMLDVAAAGLPLGLADFSSLPRIRRMVKVKALARDMQAGFGARDVTTLSADGDWLADLGRLLVLDLSAATMPQRRHEALPDPIISIVHAINAEGLAGGPRDGLLTLLQLALDTRSDTLRELARQRGGSLGDEAAAVAQAFPRVAAASGDMPATHIALETMAARLAELYPGFSADIVDYSVTRGSA